MKSEKEGEYKWIFRRARETQIANINIDLECSEVKRRGIRFYLQTKCHNGESHIYTHSFDGCELNSGSETETWIFYFVNQGGYSFEEDEKIANPNLCGAIKRENILTKEPDPYIEELSTYWNGGNPRITMICYRTTTKPYAVIKSDGNRILTLKDFDCHDKKTIVQKLYIRTTSGYKDTSQVVVGSRMYKTSGWCFYRVATKEEKNNVWVDYDYEPDELALQWYQEGSCPAVPREKIIFNRESNGNGQDTPWSLKQTFVLTTSKEYKILYCYLVNNDYISVLKSVKGNHELTIEGVNCLKPVLYINYMEIGEKTYLVLWTRKSTDWCRYDICLNCHKPDDIQFNIDDIQFNIDDHPKYSNKWAMAKQTTVQVYDTRDNEKDLDFWRSRRYRSNSAAHLMETDRWIRNVHRDKLHIIPTVKLSSIPNINENQEKSALIAKFATNDDSKFQLHCYMQKDTGTYFAVITDANGEHIVTASNQDCSSRFTVNEYVGLIKDGTIVEGVIILKTGVHSIHYYAICWKCETSFIIKKENYDNSDIHNWKEIPLDDCPLLKREDIFIEENKFVVDESKFVARYVNNGGEEKRMFMLHCYSTGDTDNKNEYLSVLRNLEGSHLLSIKGLDCSSSEQLNSVSYISIKFGMEEMIYLGTQANTRSLPYPSCQYAISTTSKVISKVDNYLIFYKDFFEWSEAGIKMPREWCPTAKLEAFGDFFRSTTLAEYAEKELNIFGLDCYKPESQNDYYLQLRISKGIHIVTIPSSRDCKKKENLIKQFYVTKNTKTQKHLFKMDHPDITYLIESCWNVQSNEEITDIWFYHFLIKKPYDNMWKLQNEQDKNCPAIMKSDITLTKQSLEEGGTKAEYRNGGNKRVTLVCHDCQPSNFATVSSSVNDLVLKIYKLNCLDETQLYEKIYVDIDDFGIIVVGSRKSIDDAWCWYSFYQPGDKIEHAWTFYNYRPNTIVAQWYKKESEGCNAVKSEQILTKDNELSLDNRRFHSMYIVDISYNCLDESYRCKQEILYNYCYYMGNAGGNRRYVMDITNVKGGHLATLTDFDCTSFDLAKNSYMFTMRESGYSDYLAVGTRTDSEDGWCQYDICVDCKPKEVRTNINTQKIRNGREINLYWEKATSLKCRAVKSENIFTNEDKKNEDNKNLQSVFVMKVMVHMNRGYLKLGEFLNYCFYEQGVDGTRQYMLVIRTTKGLHLATIKDFDCFPDAPLSLPDKTYMFQLTDSGNDYLALGTRTSTKDEWCQYDICLNCKTTFIRRNVYRESHYGLRIFQWKPVVLVKNYLTQSDKSKEVVVQEKWDNTMKLIAKYESGGFKLDCYQDCRSSKYTYTSVVFDPDGKKIAELLEHDCYSVEKLREKLTIFIPKTIENEDDAKCLLIDFSSSSLPNNYKCCTHTECIECNKQIIESVNEEIIIKGKWVKVPTETCYSMPQESIFTVSSEVNLNGYNALATYINEGHSDEDTFVLVCYQNDNLNKGDRIMSHLKSLNGQHVVYIRNLDCLSENTLSRVSYMTVMKEYRYLKNFGTKEYRYLVLGTRSTMEEGNGPWCRYDICISCSNTDIRVNAADDPGSLKPFKWSMAGLKLTTPEENTCEGQQISSSTIVSRHVNVNYLEFSIECHYLSDPQAKDYCSVLKRHETPLVTFAKTDCATNYALKRNFYLYTLYKDFEFSLIRLDQTKYLLEKSTEKESIKEHWLYYFERKEETKTTDWVMVTNPKKWTIESIDFQESEEKKDCLPQSKKLSDLKAP